MRAKRIKGSTEHYPVLARVSCRRTGRRRRNPRSPNFFTTMTTSTTIQVPVARNTGDPPLGEFLVTFADGTTVRTRGADYVEACIHAVSSQLRSRRAALIARVQEEWPGEEEPLFEPLDIQHDMYLDLRLVPKSWAQRWRDLRVWLGYNLVRLGVLAVVIAAMWFFWELVLMLWSRS